MRIYVYSSALWKSFLITGKSLICFTKKVKQNNCRDKIDHDEYYVTRYITQITRNQTMTILYARKSIIPSNKYTKVQID